MRKRRTRKEKIIADLHRKLQTQGAKVVFSSSLPKVVQKTIPMYQPVSTITRFPHSPFVGSDLLKTFALTGSIIALELLLLFAQKQHLIGKIGF